MFGLDLDKRVLKKSKKVEYLLGFKGYPDSHNQWYPFNPNSHADWSQEWHLLQAFDPSVGAFTDSTPTPVRLLVLAEHNLYHTFIVGV